MNPSEQRNYRAAVFDLDGTLVDSMPHVVRAFIHAIRPFRPEPSYAEVIASLGGPTDACLRNLLGDDRHLEAARERLFAYERDRDTDIVPFDGIRDWLGDLHRAGVPIGLWTGRDRFSTERVLAAHGLSAYFSAMVCGDDLSSHKPDPEGLKAVIDRLDFAPREVVFFGDSDIDVLGGHAIGVDTVLTSHGRTIPPTIAGRAVLTVRLPHEAWQSLRARLISP